MRILFLLLLCALFDSIIVLSLLRWHQKNLCNSPPLFQPLLFISFLKNFHVLKRNLLEVQHRRYTVDRGILRADGQDSETMPSEGFSQKETELKEIQNILNNKPLTYPYTENFNETLTPNKLLFGRVISNQVQPHKRVKTTEPQDQLKHLRTPTGHFWNGWKYKYLLKLREHDKRKKLHGNAHPTCSSRTSDSNERTNKRTNEQRNTCFTLSSRFPFVNRFCNLFTSHAIAMEPMQTLACKGKFGVDAFSIVVAIICLAMVVICESWMRKE